VLLGTLQGCFRKALPRFQNANYRSKAGKWPYSLYLLSSQSLWVWYWRCDWHRRSRWNHRNFQYTSQHPSHNRANWRSMLTI